MSRRIDKWPIKDSLDSSDYVLLDTPSGQRRILRADFYTALENEGFRKSPRMVVKAAQTAAYQVLISDEIVQMDTTSGALTVTLPPAADMYDSDTGVSRLVVIKKVENSGNALTVEGNGSETVDGSANQALSGSHASRTYYSDGSNMFSIAGVG